MRLNDGFQSRLVVIVEPDEAKGLQRPGARAQHFCGAEHHSGPGQKHQFRIASGVDRTSQGKQSAGERNNSQLARDATSILEPKDSRGGLGKMRSRRPRRRP